MPAFLERRGSAGVPTEPSESLSRATPCRQLIEHYRPIAESLEWRLAELHWVKEGVTPFVESGVPYVVNNTGTLSSDVAAVVFASCVEASPGDDLRVVELGAGTGLFARFFLDEFQRLCDRHSRDFYRRLTYWATDRSPRTVEQWQEKDLFGFHAGRVVVRVCDARGVHELLEAPVRAALANYVLDVLPAAAIRQVNGRWEQLHVQACLNVDPGVLRQYTRLTFDEIRALARSSAPVDLSTLLPILPLLENNAEYFPVEPEELPGLESELADSEATVFNYGALRCLDSVFPLLERGGFLMINDYAAQSPASGASPGGERFGPSRAVGLNLPLIERHARAAGFDVLTPKGDETLRVHPRLVLRPGGEAARRVFESRFSAAARGKTEAHLETARRHAESGSWREAVCGYRECLALNPHDWQVVGEAAAFVAERLHDYSTALELIGAALALNPWYEPSLWNLAGDALAAMERADEAHECYLEAHRIHPRNPSTSLSLARSWLALGEPGRSLEAVANGLANDSQAMVRHLLLEQQQRAISDLARRWNAERETASRRRC
jgi:tetratricopeptide (TPR) repeat protein